MTSCEKSWFSKHDSSKQIQDAGVYTEIGTPKWRVILAQSPKFGFARPD